MILFFSFNKLLAESLGYIGKCHKFSDKTFRVKLYFNCQGFTENFINETLGANAITIGKTILTPKRTLSTNTYLHELAHIKQYSYLGPAFLPLYGIAQIVAIIDSEINNYSNPHARNIFEIWANNLADLPAEPVIPK